MCALLGYYAAVIGRSVPTFRDNLSVQSSKVKKFKKFLVRNYHSTLHNIPEERKSHLHCGGSLKSRRAVFYVSKITQGSVLCGQNHAGTVFYAAKIMQGSVLCGQSHAGAVFCLDRRVCYLLPPRRTCSAQNVF
jgi:hypothetical protein